MRLGLAIVVLGGLCAPGLAQDKKEKTDPDLLWQKEWGFSIQKPVKNEEWEFKDHMLYTNSHGVVSHKVDRVFIEVFAQEKAGGTSYFDPKAAAESEWKTLSTEFKDAKKVQDIKVAKLPNGGANNPMSYLLDMTGKDKEGRATELKCWSFVGKENQYFYRIFLVGDEGMYKKHQKDLDLILGSLKILRIPK
jgi:hypothetical protein